MAGIRQLNASQRADSIATVREDSAALAETENTIGGRLRKYMQSRPTRFSDAVNDASIKTQIARGKANPSPRIHEASGPDIAMSAADRAAIARMRKP